LTWRGLITTFATLLCLHVATAAPRPAAAQTLADLVQTSKHAQGGGALFGSVELESNSLKGLPQWTRVLGAMANQRKAFDDCAADAILCTSPILKYWRQIITTAAALPRRERIKAVNDFFNRWPYKLDREVYGVSEYWATPKEFMTRSGDCEDYSIAKYFALRELGFKKEELRVVILMDTIRGIGHAVLAYYTKDEILILDSLSNLILPHSRYKHYVPQYSMNETTRWAHIGGPKNKKTDVYRGLLAKKPK
jgi:predicted transglutaminase-like cysteine proteinase